MGAHSHTHTNKHNTEITRERCSPPPSPNRFVLGGTHNPRMWQSIFLAVRPLCAPLHQHLRELLLLPPSIAGVWHYWSICLTHSGLPHMTFRRKSVFRVSMLASSAENAAPSRRKPNSSGCRMPREESPARLGRPPAVAEIGEIREMNPLAHKIRTSSSSRMGILWCVALDGMDGILSATPVKKSGNRAAFPWWQKADAAGQEHWNWRAKTPKFAEALLACNCRVKLQTHLL